MYWDRDLQTKKSWLKGFLIPFFFQRVFDTSQTLWGSKSNFLKKEMSLGRQTQEKEKFFYLILFLSMSSFIKHVSHLSWITQGLIFGAEIFEISLNTDILILSIWPNIVPEVTSNTISIMRWTSCCSRQTTTLRGSNRISITKNNEINHKEQPIANNQDLTRFGQLAYVLGAIHGERFQFGRRLQWLLASLNTRELSAT